jgi:hypothetical protein
VSIVNNLIQGGGGNSAALSITGAMSIASSGFPIAAEQEQKLPIEMPLTFGTEPLVAWRVWRLMDFDRRGGIEEQRLSAYAMSTEPWPPRKRFEARCCTEGSHEAPWPDCTCGIWAVPNENGTDHLDGEVVGEVYLWGRVLEFERGYRAQYAYPKHLYVSRADLSSDSATELARLYGVPVSFPEST